MLNTSAFTTLKVKPKTTLNFSAFGGVSVKPEVKKQGVAGLSLDLGGGQYNLGDATSTRSYAGIDTPGQYREHIFPLALGGTSNFDNIKVYGKDLGAQKAKYETEIIDQYKKGKLTLPEARGLVLKKYRELTGLDPKQGITANLPSAMKETLTGFGKGVLDLGKSILRAPQRAITSVAIQPIADTLSLIQNKKVEAEYTPKTTFEKMIFGDEPIKGIFKEVKEAEAFSKKTLEKIGFDKNTSQGMALAIAPLFVGGMKSLDITPIGGGEKKLAKEAGAIVKRFAPEERTLMQSFIDIVRGVKKAPKEEVSLIKKQATELADNFRLPEAIKSDKTLANRFDGLLTEQAGEYKNVVKEIESGLNTSAFDNVKPKVDPLMQEAKGKSLKNFIQNIKGGATQYEKYNPSVRAEIPAGYKNISELGINPEETVTIYRGIDDITGKVKKTINDGDFVTTDYDSALSYTGDPKNVVKMQVKAKHLFNSEPRDFIDEPFYTGAEFIYTKKNIKPLPTDVELTDIWNKANKSTKAINDVTNEMGVARLPKTLVNIAEDIAPIKHQEPVVQKTFKDWTRKLLVGEEQANKQVAKIPKVADGLDEILKYESGVETVNYKVIKDNFNELYQQAQNNGVKLPFRTNYLPQVYKNTTEEVKTATAKYMEDKGVSIDDISKYLEGIKELPEDVSLRLKLNGFFTKERAFPNYKTAMEYGLKPKYTDAGNLLAHYTEELNKTVANKAFVDNLLKNRQIATVDHAGPDWEALTIPFSPKGYYAPPKLAKMINGMFRNEELLGAGAKILKGAGNLSKTMQEVVLSAGLPGTSVNFFAIGQLVKNLTAGDAKAAVAFIRSNFNGASIKYFMRNANYVEKMANQGVDVLARVDKYDVIAKNLNNIKGLGKKVGFIWDKAFGEKTFKSFIPQMQVQTFKDTYVNAIKKGMAEEKAEILAGDTVKAFYGLMENVGRGKGTEDFLSATFFAPKFREGIIRTLGNTGKSITTEIFNPAFRNNRKLLAGMLLTYAGYNALNKKLSGHYMWDNPDGKEFDLMIPTTMGNNKDDIVYLGFMPSFLSFARNLASGGIALAKGDMPTAKQKIGSLFSMPIKLASEMWANKDYFGRDIYKEFDDKTAKIKKLAKYAFLSVNHPFIKEFYNQMTSDKPLYQSLSEAMEMPFKFSSYTKIQKQEFYDAIDKQKTVEAKIKAGFTPKYTEIRALLDEGKIEEATAMTSALNPEDYKLYQSLKRADKTRADVNKQIEVFDTYKKIKSLMANGQVDEATALTSKMSKEEYAAYRQLKAKLE